MAKCPKCSSEKVEYVAVLGSKFLRCKACGFDASEEVLDVYPEGRSTQSAKGKFSPYKRGGARRAAR